MEANPLQTPEAPRGLRIVNSLAMVCILAAASLALAAVGDWNPSGKILSVVVGGLLLAVFGQAYRSAFRGSSAAALAFAQSSLWFAILAAAFLILGIAGLCFGVEGAGPPVVCGASLLLISLAAQCAWQNRDWSELLAEWERQCELSPQPAAPPSARYSMRELFGLMLTMCVLIGAARYIARQQLPQRAEGVSWQFSPLRLPAGSFNVSYEQDEHGYLLLEFSIDEANFVEWAERLPELLSAGNFVSVEPVQATYMIERHNHSQAVIERGWFFEKSSGSFRVAFDANTGRAYYCKYGR